VVLFGASYAVASLSCTLAVFLIVVSQAVAATNPVRMLAVFGAYAAGSATVLVALSLSAALAKAAVARNVRWLAPLVSRLAGALLAASGVGARLSAAAGGPRAPAARDQRRPGRGMLSRSFPGAVRPRVGARGGGRTLTEPRPRPCARRKAALLVPAGLGEASRRCTTDW
jgi:hypothetical protein